MSTGMLADTDCQSVEALQLEGFSDKIMRCKACLAVNHGDALLALRKPSGLFRHCECSELRKVWCRSYIEIVPIHSSIIEMLGLIVR